jgi:hypothetical protein
MNFITHKQRLIDSIKIILVKPKADIIQGIKPILTNAKNLFKSKQYDFWLKQLGTIPIEEIPITHYGLDAAKRSLKNTDNLTRNSLDSTIIYICEKLFSYCSEEDMCAMQSDYHYYYYIPESRVFKVSTLGMSDLNIPNVRMDEIRIAKISELNINREELL